MKRTVTPSIDAQDSAAFLSKMSQDSKRRSRGIASATLTAFFGKATTLLVSAAIVPITIRYLGSEGYGLWITISSAAIPLKIAPATK